MEPYDLLEVGHHPVKEEWRSVTITSGALSVMTHGTVWMPVLPACTLAIAMKVIKLIIHGTNIIYSLYYYTTQNLMVPILLFKWPLEHIIQFNIRN